MVVTKLINGKRGSRGSVREALSIINGAALEAQSEIEKKEGELTLYEKNLFQQMEDYTNDSYRLAVLENARLELEKNLRLIPQMVPNGIERLMHNFKELNPNLDLGYIDRAQTLAREAVALGVDAGAIGRKRK